MQHEDRTSLSYLSLLTTVVLILAGTYISGRCAQFVEVVQGWCRAAADETGITLPLEK